MENLQYCHHIRWIIKHVFFLLKIKNDTYSFKLVKYIVRIQIQSHRK